MARPRWRSLVVKRAKVTQDQDQDQGLEQDGDQRMQIQEPGNILQEEFRLGRQEI
jgi:hypothetical protein